MKDFGPKNKTRRVSVNEISTPIVMDKPTAEQIVKAKWPEENVYCRHTKNKCQIVRVNGYRRHPVSGWFWTHAEAWQDAAARLEKGDTSNGSTNDLLPLS